MSKVTEYIDNLFFLMPRTEAAAEMRLKLIESSEDKYEALLGWGKSEEEALGIVVSEFGSMEEICAELGVAPIGMNGNDTEMQLQQEFAAASKKLALGIASGVTVCVLGLAACILLSTVYWDGVLAAVVMFLLWGIGAGLIVFSSIYYSRMKKLIQMGMLPRHAQHAEGNGRHWAKKIEDVLCSLIMLGATGLFFLLGVFQGRWHPAWVLFPLGGILCGVISTILGAIAKK